MGTYIARVKDHIFYFRKYTIQFVFQVLFPICRFVPCVNHRVSSCRRLKAPGHSSTNGWDSPQACMGRFLNSRRKMAGVYPPLFSYAISPPKNGGVWCREGFRGLPPPSPSERGFQTTLFLPWKPASLCHPFPRGKTAPSGPRSSRSGVPSHGHRVVWRLQVFQRPFVPQCFDPIYRHSSLKPFIF